MRASIIAPLFALAASVSALQITSPTGNNATLDLSKENTITWTTVSSDPATVRVDLVNFNVNPPTTVLIADNVATKDLKLSVPPQSNVTVGSAYQFNFVGKDAMNTGIIAQTNQFSVTKVADKATTTSSAGSTTQTSAAPASTTSARASGAEKVGAWSVAGLLVAGAFAALL